MPVHRRTWLACLVLALAVACRTAEDGTPAPAPTVESARPAPAAGMARPAESQPLVERPRVLTLPSGASLDVEPAATDRQGRLRLPDDVDRAGWWDGGAGLGDLFGAIVLAAHLDSFAEGAGPVADLLDARPGEVLLLGSRTLAQEFVVTSVRFVPRASLATQERLMGFAGARRVVVITCGGPYDAAYGGYRDNVVVVAEPRAPARRTG